MGKKAVLEQNELCPTSVSGLTVQLWGELLLLGFTRFRSGSNSKRERRTLYAWRLFFEGQDLWAESARQRRDWDLLFLLLSGAESSLYNLLSNTFSLRFTYRMTILLDLGHAFPQWKTRPWKIQIMEVKRQQSWWPLEVQRNNRPSQELTK
jgi:hypothetical protein